MKTRRPPHGKRRAIWPSLSLSSFGRARSLFPSSSSPSPSPVPARLKLLLLLPSGVLPPAAPSTPLPLPPSSSSPAAGIMKVATSPAAPAHTSRSRRPSRPPPHRRCIVRLLSRRRRRRRRRRDLLLAFEMIMPSRPGDTETERKEERKKRVTARRAERERIS